MADARSAPAHIPSDVVREPETIVLREHRSQTVSLADDDALALRDVMGGRVAVTRGDRDGAWLLRAGSWAGVATLPSGRRVIVEPKARIDTLFAMIAQVYDPRHDPFRDQPFAYDTVEGLFEFMVQVFISRVEDIVMRGVLRGYTTVTEDLPAVRGRLLVAESLRRRPVLRDRQWCSYGHLSADIPENRVLLWTASLLAAGRYRDSSFAPRLRRIIATMHDVTVTPDAPLFVERIEFHRLNDHYQPALLIAALLLDHLVYSGRVGNATFLSFLIDMNKLFEKYVESVLRRELAAHGIEIQAQPHWPLDRSRHVMLRPDVVLLRGGKPLIAVDAKYKLEEDRNDIYQMVAYCHGLGVRDGVLVSPEDSKSVERTLSILGAGDLRLHQVAASLSGGQADLHEQARRMARHILEIVERSDAYPATS